ncbi:MAG: hypothetical protein ACYTEL_26235 [Planctomycetota bacterium]|jgi:hypothetical protein
MGDALEAFADRLKPEVVEQIKSWSHHPELCKLRAKLRSVKEGQRFLDHYGEALVARHLLKKACKLAVEVPTANGRNADFAVTKDSYTFFVHIKRLNVDQETEKEIRIHNRLQDLKRIEKPIFLSGTFFKVLTDAEMQEVYRRAKRFVEQGQKGDQMTIVDSRGDEVAELEIGPEHSGRHVQTLIVMSVKCVDDRERLYRKLSDAYRQFMPGKLNAILVTGLWADDVEDFESALLGRTYEVLDGIPPNANVIERGRKADGFWSNNKHPASKVAGWFNVDVKGGSASFRMWYRGSQDVPTFVGELFTDK